MPQRFGDWQNVWADLNLTPEEQARIREGFELARQRWQNMSTEEREAEMARMRDGWQRWQNMSDQERQDAMQRIRQQFEEWRRSGRAELPIPSLD
jgi:TRAP-type C4-dicarboxylate transport system substrate-binding protein